MIKVGDTVKIIGKTLSGCELFIDKAMDTIDMT